MPIDRTGNGVFSKPTTLTDRLTAGLGQYVQQNAAAAPSGGGGGGLPLSAIQANFGIAGLTPGPDGLWYATDSQGNSYRFSQSGGDSYTLDTSWGTPALISQKLNGGGGGGGATPAGRQLVQAGGGRTYVFNPNTGAVEAGPQLPTDVQYQYQTNANGDLVAVNPNNPNDVRVVQPGFGPNANASEQQRQFESDRQYQLQQEQMQQALAQNMLGAEQFNIGNQINAQEGVRSRGLAAAQGLANYGLQASQASRDVLRGPSDFAFRSYSERGVTPPEAMVTHSDLLKQIADQFDKIAGAYQQSTAGYDIPRVDPQKLLAGIQSGQTQARPGAPQPAAATPSPQQSKPLGGRTDVIPEFQPDGSVIYTPVSEYKSPVPAIAAATNPAAGGVSPAALAQSKGTGNLGQDILTAMGIPQAQALSKQAAKFSTANTTQKASTRNTDTGDLGAQRGATYNGPAYQPSQSPGDFFSTPLYKSVPNLVQSPGFADAFSTPLSDYIPDVASGAGNLFSGLFSNYASNLQSHKRYQGYDEGGMTTDRAFLGNEKGSELFINPTGAPLMIVPHDQTQDLHVKGYDGGTLDPRAVAQFLWNNTKGTVGEMAHAGQFFGNGLDRMGLGGAGRAGAGALNRLPGAARGALDMALSPLSVVGAGIGRAGAEAAPAYNTSARTGQLLNIYDQNRMRELAQRIGSQGLKGYAGGTLTDWNGMDATAAVNAFNAAQQVGGGAPSFDAARQANMSNPAYAGLNFQTYDQAHGNGPGSAAYASQVNSNPMTHINGIDLNSMIQGLRPQALSQDQILADEARLRPPAVNALVTGQQQNPLRIGGGPGAGGPQLTTGYAYNQLTPDEKQALATTLGIKWNTTPEDYLQASNNLFNSGANQRLLRQTYR